MCSVEVMKLHFKSKTKFHQFRRTENRYTAFIQYINADVQYVQTHFPIEKASKSIVTINY